MNNESEIKFLNHMKLELRRMIHENFNPYMMIIEIDERLKDIEKNKEKVTK
jgi:hypothetical protein